jgi:hypothetical protein
MIQKQRYLLFRLAIGISTRWWLNVEDLLFLAHAPRTRDMEQLVFSRADEELAGYISSPVP